MDLIQNVKDEMNSSIEGVMSNSLTKLYLLSDWQRNEITLLMERAIRKSPDNNKILKRIQYMIGEFYRTERTIQRYDIAIRE